MKNGFPALRAKQNGAILVISLIILLVLTILGISGMRQTTLEERMAGNTRDHQLAFQAAEAGLRGAEKYIDDHVIDLSNFDTDGSDGLYDNSVENIWDSVDWTGSDSGNTKKALTDSTFGASQGVSQAPEYVIQHYGSVVDDADTLNLGGYGQSTGAGAVEMFRITVRATGGSSNAVVILQSTYGKRL